jgi:hypothetical protein
MTLLSNHFLKKKKLFCVYHTILMIVNLVKIIKSGPYAILPKIQNFKHKNSLNYYVNDLEQTKLKLVFQILVTNLTKKF